MCGFQTAVPVWGTNLKHRWNQFLGFHTEIFLEEEGPVHFAIAARSCYRLYIDGEMRAHGPARTGHGYARIDEFEINLKGRVQVAVEVASYDKPDKISNDITLEPGMFAAEISSGGKILAATGSEGKNHFMYQELDGRAEMTELISHAREITEQYDLSEASFKWRLSGEGMREPQPLNENIPEFLERRAPYAAYTFHPVSMLINVSDSVPVENVPLSGGPAVFMQAQWYQKLKDRTVDQINAEEERAFTGSFSYCGAAEKESGVRGGTDACGEIQEGCAGWKVVTGKQKAALTWTLGESFVGFLRLKVHVEQETQLELLHSDVLDKKGKPEANPCLARYHLASGTYDLITFEPYLARYIKVIIESEGAVEIREAGMVEYCFSDRKRAGFVCSDQELNLIYEGALRTLRNNTLDIFMDCPERERGGWLCDSLWTSRAAWMMLGDLNVEKDFLENFLLTDEREFQSAFFPSVYPGCTKAEDQVGITSWSFWLALELCEYYERSGDRAFIEKYEYRMAAFVNGVMEYIGESGLLENLPNLFVDWSEANNACNLYPISIPVNMLAAYTLESLGDLYQHNEWKETAKKISEKCESPGLGFFAESNPGMVTDARFYENGQFRETQSATEAGIFLELWSGWYKGGHERLVRNFIERMGTCPAKPSNILIAKANLFIGLAIRMDTLSLLGKVDTLVREMKNIYIPQMINGPGTLFEGISRDGLCGSLCHGFNGHAGVLLMRDILGIGEPHRKDKTVRIAPHAAEGVTWAAGYVDCIDGEIRVNWTADHEEKKMEIRVSVPEGWKAEFEFDETEGWQITKNMK